MNDPVLWLILLVGLVCIAAAALGIWWGRARKPRPARHLHRDPWPSPPPPQRAHREARPHRSHDDDEPMPPLVIPVFDPGPARDPEPVFTGGGGESGGGGASGGWDGGSSSSDSSSGGSDSGGGGSDSS